MSTPFYDTDLTDAAWAWIAPILPAARPGGRPRIVIAVQLHLRDLEGKVGGTGINELLVVLLDFCFSVHHLESGQKLDINHICRELFRDPRGIFLAVQFAALGDDGCSRRLKVLRSVLLRSGGQSCSDCYRYDGKQELPCRGHANRLQVINHKEATNIGRIAPEKTTNALFSVLKQILAMTPTESRAPRPRPCKVHNRGL